MLYSFPGNLNVGIDFTDTGETITLVLGDRRKVIKGLVQPAVRITIASEILDRIMKREVDAFALAGRSHIKEKRPIDFDSIDSSRTGEVMETIKGLATFFFNHGKIKTKELRLDLAGDTHGARLIPLVYWKGLRFKWYHVPAGTTLNKKGEIDP